MFSIYTDEMKRMKGPNLVCDIKANNYENQNLYIEKQRENEGFIELMENVNIRSEINYILMDTTVLERSMREPNRKDSISV